MKPVSNIFSLHIDAEWPRQHLDLFGRSEPGAFRPPKPRYTLTIRYGAEGQPPDERPVLLRMWGDAIELGGDETRKVLAAMIERANRPEFRRPADAARQAVADQRARSQWDQVGAQADEAFAEAEPVLVLSDLTIRVHSDDPETLVQVFYKGDPVAANVVLNQRPPM